MLWICKCLLVSVSILTVLSAVLDRRNLDMEGMFLFTQVVHLPDGSQILARESNSSSVTRTDGFVHYELQVHGARCTLLVKAEYEHMFLMQAVGPPTFTVITDTCGISKTPTK